MTGHQRGSRFLMDVSSRWFLSRTLSPPWPCGRALSTSSLRRSAPAGGSRSPRRSRQRGSQEEDMPEPSHCVTFDNFGTWNKTMEPILIEESIRRGIPIPRIGINHVTCTSLIGRRTENEDRYCSMELLPNLLMFGIFDGHGGCKAPDYAVSHMENHIRYWLSNTDDLKEILINSFLDLNNCLQKHLHTHSTGQADSFQSGTTATVALLRDSYELVVGHVGDSDAILCRDGMSVKLSSNHSPENDDEKKRIKSNGGFISNNSFGQLLVNGRLAMTRSLGDSQLKRFGVSAHPAIQSIEVKHSKDGFLVFTTDGINSVMSDQEICNCVLNCDDPVFAASFLCDQAMQFGSDDNTTVMIIQLGAWGKFNASSPNFSRVYIGGMKD